MCVLVSPVDCRGLHGLLPVQVSLCVYSGWSLVYSGPHGTAMHGGLSPRMAIIASVLGVSLCG